MPAKPEETARVHAQPMASNAQGHPVQTPSAYSHDCTVDVDELESHSDRARRYLRALFEAYSPKAPVEATAASTFILTNLNSHAGNQIRLRAARGMGEREPGWERCVGCGRSSDDDGSEMFASAEGHWRAHTARVGRCGRRPCAQGTLCREKDDQASRDAAYS